MLTQDLLTLATKRSHLPPPPPPHPTSPFPFLSLPPELRHMIYTHFCSPQPHLFPSPQNFTTIPRATLTAKLSLALTCHLIHAEYLPLLYRHHDFRFQILAPDVRKEWFWCMPYSSEEAWLRDQRRWQLESGVFDLDYDEEEDDKLATMPDPGLTWLFHGRHIPHQYHVMMMQKLRHVTLHIACTSGEDFLGALITAPDAGGAEQHVLATLQYLAEYCPQLRTLTVEMEETYGLWLDEWMIHPLRHRGEVVDVLKLLAGRCRGIEIVVVKDAEDFGEVGGICGWTGGGEGVERWVGEIAGEGGWWRKEVWIPEVYPDVWPQVWPEDYARCVYSLDCEMLRREEEKVHPLM